jgi:hypothetical protein
MAFRSTGIWAGWVLERIAAGGEICAERRLGSLVRRLHSTPCYATRMQDSTPVDMVERRDMPLQMLL